MNRDLQRDKVRPMREKPSETCTYLPGDGVCWRGDCPKCCMRNYRDQFASDVPTLPEEKKASPLRRARRRRQPKILRLISRLKKRS